MAKFAAEFKTLAVEPWCAGAILYVVGAYPDDVVRKDPGRL
jgi:hypothetical protein